MRITAEFITTCGTRKVRKEKHGAPNLHQLAKDQLDSKFVLQTILFSIFMIFKLLLLDKSTIQFYTKYFLPKAATYVAFLARNFWC